MIEVRYAVCPETGTVALVVGKDDRTVIVAHLAQEDADVAHDLQAGLQVLMSLRTRQSPYGKIEKIPVGPLAPAGKVA